MNLDQQIRPILVLLMFFLMACQPEQIPLSLTAPRPSDLPGQPTKSPPVSSTHNSAESTIIGDKNLLGPLVIQAYTIWDPVQQEATLPRILLGRLPSRLPFDLQLSDDTTLVGSITGPAEVYGQIHLTSTRSPSATLQSLTTSLIRQGFESPENASPDDVFLQNPDLPTSAPMLCNRSRDTVVWSTAYKASNSTTNVRIHIEKSGPEGPCTLLDHPPDTASSLPLPTLITPPGTQILTQSRSSGQNGAWIAADLVSKQSTAELASIFDQQLADERWQIQSTGTNEYAAWSLWTFEDEHARLWAGSLYVFTNPISSTRKTVMLRADSTDQ